MGHLVNLFMVGAAKSGTTSLANLLSSHEKVYLPEMKEPHYFLTDKGIDSYDEYIKLYSDKEQEYFLDASTGYLFDSSSAESIHKYNPCSKIIIVLRNPIDMIASYWEYMKANGRETLTFEEAITTDVENYRMSDEFARVCEQWPYSYVYRPRAKYYEQVKKYIDFFGVNNVHVAVFEDIVRNSSSIKDIYDFIGLACDANVKLPRDNQSGSPNKIIRWIRFSPLLNRFKLIYRKLFPLVLRVKLRNLLIKNTMSTKNHQKYKVTGSLRVQLKEYYSSDVDNLKKLLPDSKLNLWGDFHE